MDGQILHTIGDVIMPVDIQKRRAYSELIDISPEKTTFSHFISIWLINRRFIYSKLNYPDTIYQ